MYLKFGNDKSMTTKILFLNYCFWLSIPFGDTLGRSFFCGYNEKDYKQRETTSFNLGLFHY